MKRLLPQVAFRQRVTLARDPEAKLVATTWQESDFGLSRRTDMLEIKGVVNDLVAEFLADCQAANPDAPKKSETGK